MIIIIGKISAKTRKQDLINFVHPTIKGNFFQKPGQLTYVKVVTHIDKLSEKIHYYGMILIPSDIVAERVIRKLNKKRLLGALVTVRKYHSRSWRNDPRVNNAQFNNELKNMRKGDRRQSSLEERKQTTIEFTGHKSFSRNRL